MNTGLAAFHRTAGRLKVAGDAARSLWPGDKRKLSRLGYDLSGRWYDVDDDFLDGEVIAADGPAGFVFQRGTVGHQITNRTLPAIRRRGSVLVTAASEIRYHRVLLRFLMPVTAGSAKGRCFPLRAPANGKSNAV